MFCMNDFISLTGHKYNNRNEFDYYLYQGILRPASKGDVDTVIFNLQELHEEFSGCEKYERAILQTASKLANAYNAKNKKESEGKLKLVNYLSQKIESIGEEGQEKKIDQQRVTVRINEGNQDSGWLSSFTSIMVKFLALGACAYLGRNIYNTMQTIQIKQTVTAIQNEVENGQIDLCQIEATRHICQNNLGVLRDDMPQVDGAVKTNYVNFKLGTGHTVREVTLNAKTLIPIQAEMNAKIVGGMLESALNGDFDPCSAEKYGPILVAQDPVTKSNHVIDGHHRFAACNKLNGRMQVLQVVETPRKVLNELESFPGVTRASMSSMNYARTA